MKPQNTSPCLEVSTVEHPTPHTSAYDTGNDPPYSIALRLYQKSEFQRVAPPSQSSEIPPIVKHTQVGEAKVICKSLDNILQNMPNQTIAINAGQNGHSSRSNTESDNEIQPASQPHQQASKQYYQQHNIFQQPHNQYHHTQQHNQLNGQSQLNPQYHEGQHTEHNQTNPARQQHNEHEENRPNTQQYPQGQQQQNNQQHNQPQKTAYHNPSQEHHHIQQHSPQFLQHPRQISQPLPHASTSQQVPPQAPYPAFPRTFNQFPQLPNPYIQQWQTPALYWPQHPYNQCQQILQPYWQPYWQHPLPVLQQRPPLQAFESPWQPPGEILVQNTQKETRGAEGLDPVHVLSLLTGAAQSIVTRTTSRSESSLCPLPLNSSSGPNGWNFQPIQQLQMNPPKVIQLDPSMSSSVIRSVGLNVNNAPGVKSPSNMNETLNTSESVNEVTRLAEANAKDPKNHPGRVVEPQASINKEREHTHTRRPMPPGQGQDEVPPNGESSTGVRVSNETLSNASNMELDTINMGPSTSSNPSDMKPLTKHLLNILSPVLLKYSGATLPMVYIPDENCPNAVANEEIRNRNGVGKTPTNVNCRGAKRCLSNETCTGEDQLQQQTHMNSQPKKRGRKSKKKLN